LGTKLHGLDPTTLEVATTVPMPQPVDALVVTAAGAVYGRQPSTASIQHRAPIGATGGAPTRIGVV
jgi:hypothetical protein